MIRLMTAEVSGLRESEAFRKYLEEVPGFRREKVLRLRREGDRALSLGAWLLVQQALEEAGYPRDLAPARGEHGKPEFQEIGEQFQFNLSHSGSRALCVVSHSPEGKAQAVGCDIQEIGEADLRLAERFFTQEEAESVFALATPEERRERFYRLWVLKESFLKATGKGLTLGLGSFTVRTRPDGTAWVWGSMGRGYRLEEVTVAPGYRAAWCTAGEEAPRGVEEVRLGQPEDGLDKPG